MSRVGAIQAVLFDLDDTLLGNKTRRFVQAYCEALAEYGQPLLPKAQFLPALFQSVQELVSQPDPHHTLYERFWTIFPRRTGVPATRWLPLFERFYAEAFPALRAVTRRRPLARTLVAFAFAQGWDVVIATNPIFPATAIEQRLDWAGTPVSAFPYRLVTTMERMHAAKPHERYYEEILATIGREPAQVLVVGDSWENDMMPAFSLGCHTFWVTETPTSPDPPMPWGDLGALWQLLQADWPAHPADTASEA